MSVPVLTGSMGSMMNVSLCISSLPINICYKNSCCVIVFACWVFLCLKFVFSFAVKCYQLVLFPPLQLVISSVHTYTSLSPSLSLSLPLSPSLSLSLSLSPLPLSPLSLLSLQASGGTTFVYGKPSRTVSTVYQWLPYLMRRYSVVMEVGYTYIERANSLSLKISGHNGLLMSVC